MNFDEDISLRYAKSRAEQNDAILVCGELRVNENPETTATSQTDAYDVIRGSENPSPKSFDSQYSEEDKVLKCWILTAYIVISIK